MFEVGIDLGDRLGEPITEIAVREQEDLFRRLQQGVLRASDIVLGTLRRYSSNTLLHARTGNLARMWQSQPDASDPLAVHLTNAAPYAEVQEDGSEPDHPIVPNQAKALAIPLAPYALTDGGVSRYTGPREAEASMGEKFFIWKSKSGAAFLAASRDRQLELWYLLKDKVTLQATHFASKAVEDSADRALAQVKSAASA